MGVNFEWLGQGWKGNRIGMLLVLCIIELSLSEVTELGDGPNGNLDGKDREHQSDVSPQQQKAFLGFLQLRCCFRSLNTGFRRLLVLGVCSG